MKWTCDNIPDLEGKVIIVTGGNGGIGFETVKALALKKATVIMASRSVEKAQRAKQSIIGSFVDANIDIIRLDLADLESVKQFVEVFNSRYTRLDVLFNNAGTMVTSEKITEDGFECNMGTNHFGHFALTGLMMMTIQKTPGSRIVNTSSIIHGKGCIDFDTLKSGGNNIPSGMDSYRNSKLANMVFTMGLQDYLDKHTGDSIALAAHPGITGSDIARDLLGKALFTVLKPLIKLVLQSTKKGSLPQLRAAFDPQARGGNYYGPNGKFGWSGYPVLVEPAAKARDKEDIRKLWEVSEELTGVRFP